VILERDVGQRRKALRQLVGPRVGATPLAVYGSAHLVDIVNALAVFAPNATNETDKFVRFTPVQTGMDGVDVVVGAMYIGHNMLGCPFFGSLVDAMVDTKAAEI
jgi:hypothetical protein